VGVIFLVGEKKKFLGCVRGVEIINPKKRQGDRDWSSIAKCHQYYSIRTIGIHQSHWL